MKIYLSVLPGILFAYLMAFTPLTPAVADTCECTYCVFNIQPFKWSNPADVQNIDSWEFYKMYDDSTRLSCEPGNEAACQLIVDIRDTYVTKENVRKLKPGVIIHAATHTFLNSSSSHYFVDK